MVTVLVGGLVEEPHTDYSLVETEETDCVLSLPALPSQLVLEPVVGRVNDTLLLCSTDYHGSRPGPCPAAPAWGRPCRGGS